jgi:hypothetical protein
MGVVLTKKQFEAFAGQLAEQEADATRPKVYLVADSPNLTRSVEKFYGQGARPDLAAVLQIGRRYGELYEATLVANPGLPIGVARHFQRLGFSVNLGLAPDCDDRVVSKCVSAGLVADILVCMGGDHSIVDVIRIIKLLRRPVRVVVVAVKEATALCVAKSCDDFIDLPILYSGWHPAQVFPRGVSAE